MRNRLMTVAFAVALTAANASADVAPDPTDPTEPVGMFLTVIVAVALGGLGYLLYRRRRK